MKCLIKKNIMERKEHKIGERFKDGNTLLETRKGDCPECFYSNNGCDNEEVHGPCCEQDRTDETDVFFKEIKEMKEENLNKEEHFYIWGVPNRGEEVKKLLERKGVRCPLSIESYSDEYIIIYAEHNTSLEINRLHEPSLANLITSNWTELKLPYKPKDKELVWAWDNDDCCGRVAVFFDSSNNGLFSYKGKRVGLIFDNIAKFEGEYPQWAKDALNKLEE